MDLFHKAAYLTGDGRWITYRERTGVDTNVFRLGQSFWPDPALQPKSPTDLVGKWSIHRLPEPAWARRGKRPALRAVVLLRELPQRRGRERRLRSVGRFQRRLAQSLPHLRHPGTAARAAGRSCRATTTRCSPAPTAWWSRRSPWTPPCSTATWWAPTAMAVGEVPRAAFCNWRRTLAQRTGRYAIVVDDLAFRTDSQNMKVSHHLAGPGRAMGPQGAGRAHRPPEFELRSCDVQDSSGAGVLTMNWNGAVKSGQHRIAFYLIAANAPGSSSTLACMRLADNAAAMALPQSALAVVGEYGQTEGRMRAPGRGSSLPAAR